jgi:hypothetical protein
MMLDTDIIVQVCRLWIASVLHRDLGVCYDSSAARRAAERVHAVRLNLHRGPRIPWPVCASSYVSG